ncbi:amyloid-beta A4 precursor protein-binding family A member 3 [Erpetoichthys calabaricus]|uniref:Amyloid-beta A4 precursor protein-binding family A member 3 n=1 Tax=Erpetoichthys calabaricus TaxID=27687 RepID=A0A8C4SJ49_ERPCA|nr:amyloid-beta A4 precursor protein-binding family A member 3 [Erpetoichthys calabaricus]
MDDETEPRPEEPVGGDGVNTRPSWLGLHAPAASTHGDVEDHHPLQEWSPPCLFEPPPLDWSETASLDSYSNSESCSISEAAHAHEMPEGPCPSLVPPQCPSTDCRCGPPQHVGWPSSTVAEGRDEDHNSIHVLLAQLQASDTQVTGAPSGLEEDLGAPDRLGTNSGDLQAGQDGPHTGGHADVGGGLLFSESSQRELVSFLDCEGGTALPEVASALSSSDPPLEYKAQGSEVDSVVSISYGGLAQDLKESQVEQGGPPRGQSLGTQEAEHLARQSPGSPEETPEPVWLKMHSPSLAEVEHHGKQGEDADQAGISAFKDVPGPCDPEDLLDGVIFGAKYLGSTQLLSDKNQSTNGRMRQAQEAVDRIKAPDGESQPMTEVDLFISTKRIKVLSANTQEAMMDHPLQTISYIADIGSIVVLMARRKSASRRASEASNSPATASSSKKCCMICHVFLSEDAQLIAQAIGQAFSVAYQHFLQANGIKPTELQPSEYSHYLGAQELYNGDLVHFSRSENLREICIEKPSGEILGLAIVESGWGSILPTVVVANLLHGGAAERSGELSIGDRIMSVNGTSLVGLPIATCQGIIRELKNQTQVKLSIVHCPPVTLAIIKRPDPKYQLGFSVEDGIICSLMRGGIAERGGIRVGHRIIEINGQSVVATPHDKIIQILTQAIGEIHLKTMPASTYRLLTGQDQPVFL